MNEPLIVAQREVQYGERSYRIAVDYEFEKSKYFYSFNNVNPSTLLILGGWKFHISLDPLNIDDIALAWTDIIVPELIRCGIREFKITRVNRLNEIVEGAEGQGKLITVYLRHNPELGLSQPDHRKLVDTLNRIEAGLIQAGIKPGPRPIIDHVMQGSQYMSFRCDAVLPEYGTTEWHEGVVYALEDIDAQPIADDNRTQAHNPFNIHDEYGLCVLTLEPQQAPVFSPI